MVKKLAVAGRGECWVGELHGRSAGPGHHLWSEDARFRVCRNRVERPMPHLRNFFACQYSAGRGKQVGNVVLVDTSTPSRG